jgi:2,3-bisphosphoglycerate-independent phosphoglycerate mutase
VKYVILVGDGMADEPTPELDNRTLLEAAHTPHMDSLVAQSDLFGLARTIPDGFEPGSDVGNMSILGYNPDLYYTGRAPIEAASMGIELSVDDIALRCNLVLLDKSGDKWLMEDYSAGHIETPEAHRLIELLRPTLENENFKFFPGVSYRHLCVWNLGREGIHFTPPHNISGQAIEHHFPNGEGSELLSELIEESWNILEGQQANSIWLWGAGKPPDIPTLQERFSISGAVISAVDLVKGLGLIAGLKVIDVPGATGYLDTNYQAKVDATFDALAKSDLVYIHVEAPDETGHEGDLSKKLQAIEEFDEKIVGPIIEGLRNLEPYALLLMPDHPTPIRTRAHSADPVPFLIARSGVSVRPNRHLKFSEPAAKESGTYWEDAYLLIDELLKDHD